MTDSVTPDSLSAIELSNHSRFVKRIHTRYPLWSFQSAHLVFTKADLEHEFQRVLGTFPCIEDALRVLRQLALTYIAQLDCSNQLTLQDVTQMMTHLAEWALEKAYTFAFSSLTAKFGTPYSRAGQPAEFWIVGMGKLGANELNVSSDIDLIYVFDDSGVTRPTGISAGSDSVDTKCISNQDFFTKLVHLIQVTLDSVSEHGRVFRIDTALRPNGLSGPNAISLEALEEYLQKYGREWERFAWLKSRVVAPTAHHSLPKSLLQIVTPFVYRKYLDYQVFDALRLLHKQIRAQAVKFAMGRPNRENDIKIGYGGIREIEFITQLLQIVKGGQLPELRIRSTLDALKQLELSKVIPPKSVENLSSAYVFLRNLEHRIQYLDDQQTHVLPESTQDLMWLAQSMGFNELNGFLGQLQSHRDSVNTEFELLLGDKSKANDPVINSTSDCNTSILDFVTNSDKEAFTKRVKDLLDSNRVAHLSDSSRTKLDRLILRTLEFIRKDPQQELGALRWCDWMESLLRRESYLSLLIERESIHKNLIYILGASQWANKYLIQHPGLIDDLAEIHSLQNRFNADLFLSTLNSRISHLEQEDQSDEEALLNCIRRAHHSELILCLARDLSGSLSVQEVADDLTLLAQCIIEITAHAVWRRLKNTHTTTPSFAIIGFGKLGGKELGYGSDLDIVFLYDDNHPDASQIYTNFARKIINWLSAKTSAGDLYEIDTALRPNGNSGLLVTQLQSFEDYQLQRGSNVAWVWEHQAMTRARLVLGNEYFSTQFNAIRTKVLTTKRDLPSLRLEISQMRDRLITAHPTKPGTFNLKYSKGAMIDVEFSVQYLILAFSCDYPQLCNNIGNLALLEMAAELDLISCEVAQGVQAAYRRFRQEQHKARLDERSLVFDIDLFAIEQKTVLLLWQFLFSSI
jgi:glutamate-ammonia-ligase adenylyltransferase